MASKTSAVNREPGMEWDSSALRLPWPDGRETVCPSVWLRDNCPEDRDSLTGQRLVDIADLQEQPSIQRVDFRDGSIGVRWSGEDRQSWFSLAWIGLGLHTDNPYRDPVPGFQALHCLEPSPEGGESLFTDGFAVADRLRELDPEAFVTLTRTPVPFAFRDADAEFESWRPLIELDHFGRLKAVHYNNRSIGPVRIPAGEIDEFYRAYRAFATLLRSPQFEWQCNLRKGDLVVFDNYRVLHGRRAFTGQRHLQGCYIGRDGAVQQPGDAREETTQMSLADDVIELFETCGQQAYFGEPVSIVEHSLQAAWLADRSGAGRSLVIAALLHDIGHLVHGLPENIADEGIDASHEIAGEAWLRSRVGQEVTEPVRLHVMAKRYLCHSDPEYRRQLSAASIRSLELQGGVLTEDEARAFEGNPHFHDAVKLRLWDDAAKVPGLVVPDVRAYREPLDAVEGAQR